MSNLVSFWYRSFYRRTIIQGAVILLVVLVGLALIEQVSNIENVHSPRFSSSIPFITFDFLDARAGIDLSHGLIFDIDSNDSRMDAILNGAWNTIRLAVVLIVFASLLGLLIGVGRLSDFYLIQKACTIYVEVLRNIPALLQIYIWYTVVWFITPPIAEAAHINISFFGANILTDAVIVSNKGLAIPWFVRESQLGIWFLLGFIALVISLIVRRFLQKRQDELGGNQGTNRYPALIFFGALILAYVGLGAPFTTETSSIVSSGAAGAIKNYGGGMVITGEFLAIVVALGFYTASFISEIVRGSILALPAGQTEAAKALGLSAYQRLTLIILPQALRTMIPPLGNQYINMTKNTSIAVAIGFSDVVFATRTISNNAGHSLEIFTTLLVLYLLMALVISSIMNSLNWYVQRSGI